MTNRKNGYVTKGSGLDLDKKKAGRAKANANTLASEHFKKCCGAAGVEPTKRQASKWNNGKGLAFKTKTKKV